MKFQVPQGSVLADITFLFHESNVFEGITNYVNMFSDDA